jgi:putative ABC transport system ATP-binding protein
MSDILRLEGVTKVYGSGRTAVRAVHSVNLRVKPGEIVLLMGPSGSGKTTLLSMAGLLLTPTEGDIWIEGEEVSRLPPSSMTSKRLRNIGFVFQAYNLLGALTARENVEIVLNMAGTRGKEARATAEKLLTQVGLSQRIHHVPADLSGGEKQRVAIARALANDPTLILADEPTGNLDGKSGRRVMEMLCADVGREDGRAIVIGTHDHRLTEIADRVLWLEDGKLTTPDFPLDGWSLAADAHAQADQAAS